MPLYDSPWKNLIMGLAAHNRPELLQSAFQRKRQAEEDAKEDAKEEKRYAEQQRQNKLLMDMKLAEGNRQQEQYNAVQQAGGMLGLMGVKPGQGMGMPLPPEQLKPQIAGALMRGGNASDAIGLLTPERSEANNYGGANYGINPETDKPDYFVTNKTGDVRWIGTKGRPDSSQSYFVPVPTPEGVKAFDSRKGIFKESSEKVMKSSDSPELQKQLYAAKEEGKILGDKKGMIGGKYEALNSLRGAIKYLDKGIYTGFYANFKKDATKAIPGFDSEKAANTEAFKAYIGNTVVPRLQEFGGNDSNEELRYLNNIMGGDITLEEDAIREILRSAEEKILKGIERLQNGDIIYNEKEKDIRGRNDTDRRPTDRKPLGSFFR